MDEELKCPICRVQFVTLGQLNQHLDDVHFNQRSPVASPKKRVLGQPMSPPAEQQPVAAVVAKHREEMPLLKTLKHSLSQLAIGRIIDDIKEDFRDVMDAVNTEESPTSPVEVGMKTDHFQQNERCPSCTKDLTSLPGILTAKNCARCGYMYCDSHCSYEMKLNLNALHDPEHGQWTRVCRHCYTSRDGYLSTDGQTKEWTPLWIRARKSRVEKTQLEVSRLEHRLDRLRKLYAEHFAAAPAPSSQRHSSGVRDRLRSSGASSSSLGETPKARTLREKEQEITPWQPDTEAKLCPICLNGFSKTILSSVNRRHHCRLCGRVVCGRPQCSEMMGLKLAGDDDETKIGTVRTCSQCIQSVVHRRQHFEGLEKRHDLVDLYNELVKAEQVIVMELPLFKESLVLVHNARQNPQLAKSESFVRTYHTATSQRKKLVEAFGKYDGLSKKIAALPTRNQTEKRVHASICNGAKLFLQNHMFTLQLLPRLNDIIAASESSSVASSADEKEDRTPRTSTASSASTAVKPNKFSLANLLRSPPQQPLKPPVTLTVEQQQQLEILMEQKNQLQQFVKEAIQTRRFDDVVSLKRNIEEIEREIGRIQRGE